MAELTVADDLSKHVETIAVEVVTSQGLCGYVAYRRICILPKDHPGRHGTDPPDNVCSWCGKTDTENDDDGYGPLTDIQVLIAQGEEGDARPKRYACNECMVVVTDKLVELGFGVHRHGGSNLLEPRNCPGWLHMADCPIPLSDDEQD